MATDTYLDDDGILWNTLEYSAQKGRKPNTHISKVSEIRAWTKRKGSQPPPQRVTTPAVTNHPVHPSLQQPMDPLSPFRSVISAPLTTPPPPLAHYNLRTRRVMSAAIRFPHASPPPRATTTLNLDIHGQPLTYKNAKAGPDRERWTTAEIEDLCRLIDSRTLFALPYNAPCSPYLTTLW